jgi:uncharacterized membrane protein
MVRPCARAGTVRERPAKVNRREGVPGFSLLDSLALAFFIVAWLGYTVAVERMPAHRLTLNVMMNERRRAWLEQTVVRENRIVDTTINASLQNGTAFFASTSLFAIGGSLTLFRSTEDVLTLFAELPFGLATTRVAWETKVMGLAVIFVYAFFKFGWSYRLFNYAAVLIGAVPPLKGNNEADVRAAARRAAAMNVVAAAHFNRGQRAFFFALAYLGWFVSGYVFMASTASVLFVMWRRQFASDARRAVMHEEEVG